MHMSSDLNKPYYTQFETLKPFTESKRATRRGPHVRFDHLATAAEVAGDFVAAMFGLGCAYELYRLLGLGRDIVYTRPIVLEASLVFATLFVILLDREGVYRKGSGMLRISETERTLRVAVQSFLILFPVAIFSAHLISRWVLLFGLLLIPGMVVFEKQLLFSIVRYLHTRGRGVRKAIIYGSGFTGKRVFSVLLRSRKLGIKPVIFVDDDEKQAGKTIFALSYHREESANVVQGPVTADLMKGHGVDMLVVAVPSLEQEKLFTIAAEAKKANVMLAFVPSQTIYEDAWVNYVDIDGIMLATVSPPETMYLYELAKRALDTAVAAMLLTVLSPLFALLALAVSLDSEGPIIFKQERVGKNGKLFRIFKFRSMRIDAPKYQFSPTDVGDRRITRVGRFLRKTSLDELPQILNVLRGEMSLVGPRPEMPFIVANYGPRERLRLSVLPGITGLWQLSADRAFLIHENPQYDLYYIRNRGFFMDLAILLHTLAFAVKGV
jgi:exopolysaccharide biosynthesis polyprenyl glycosylphosphotransferase